MQFEVKLDKYLRALTSFRDDVRKLAISSSTSQQILELCDKFRDEDLVNLGVQLDDGQSSTGGALYKLVDPSILIRQREEKANQIAEKQAKKAENARLAEEKRLATLEKGRIPPKDMFKAENSTEGWTEWDEMGLPIKDKEGKEISKGQSKKFLKEFKAQEKAHEAFLAWQKEGGK